jgi:hypothetical protein
LRCASVVGFVDHFSSGSGSQGAFLASEYAFVAFQAGVASVYDTRKLSDPSQSRASASQNDYNRWRRDAIVGWGSWVDPLAPDVSSSSSSLSATVDDVARSDETSLLYHWRVNESGGETKFSIDRATRSRLLTIDQTQRSTTIVEWHLTSDNRFGDVSFEIESSSRLSTAPMFSSDNGFVLCGTEVGSIVAWDSVDRDARELTCVAHRAAVYGIDYSTSGVVASFGNDTNGIRVAFPFFAHDDDDDDEENEQQHSS